MHQRLIALTLFAVLASGCPSPGPSSSSPPSSPPADAAAPADDATPPAQETPAAAEPVAIEQRELPVKCGCKLEVKKCSEWAEVDGRWVRLVGDHGMGHMPFCGKEGLRARISGELRGDELHLTSIEMVP